MSRRKEDFFTGEYYHIYNRGVDKRTVFEDKQDFYQFLEMLKYFNSEESFGGLKMSKYPKNLKHRGKTSVLVEVVAFCLLPNHFHLILKQKKEGGISKFMQKVGTGYAMYFNKKNQRTGALFGGKFKSKHVKTDKYLDYLSVYVNLNFKVHKIKEDKNKEQNYRSSYFDYIGKAKSGYLDIENASKEVLDMSPEEYRKFAELKIQGIVKNRERDIED